MTTLDTLNNPGLVQIRSCIRESTALELKEYITDLITIIDDIFTNPQNTFQLTQAFVKNLHLVHVRRQHSGFIMSILTTIDIGIFTRGANNIELTGQLSKGTYGLIYKSIVNNKPMITKVPINMTVQSITDFVTENILHLLLMCLEPQILQAIDNPKFLHFPIPKLYLMVRTKIDNVLVENIPSTLNNMIVCMQPLDMSLYAYIKSKEMKEEYLIDIIAQIAFYLYYLGNVAGFIHRDLHYNNVMLVHKPLHIKDYGLFKSKSIFDVYFIDFGQSCINLQKCEPCNMPDSFLIAGGASYRAINRVNYCNDPTYDLRVLFSSIYHERPRPNESYPWKEAKKQASWLDGMFKVWFKYYNINNWHEIYNTIGSYDDGFLPYTVLTACQIYFNKEVQEETHEETKENIPAIPSETVNESQAILEWLNSYRFEYSSLEEITSINMSGMDLNNNLDFLQYMPNLEYLILENCKLEQLPDWFGMLSNLTYLSLNENNLTTLPDSFGNLNLSKLFIDTNLIEYLPETFTSLSWLESLSITGSKLKYLPDQFGNLSYLKELDLRSNELEILPNSFTYLNHLEKVLLDFNQLTSLPNDMENMQSLKHLSLSDNQIVDLPDSFAKLDLSYLDLRQNPLSNASKDILDVIVMANQSATIFSDDFSQR